MIFYAVVMATLGWVVAILVMFEISELKERVAVLEETCRK